MGMLEGALILLAGIAIGRLLRAPREAARNPEPACGCTHHYAYHDPETGACAAGVSVPSSYSDTGSVTAYKLAPCACQRYSGPVPLPEVFAPEIGG